MPGLGKVLNEDGSYTIVADGLAVRTARDSAEADDVLLSLSYLVHEEE